MASSITHYMGDVKSQINSFLNSTIPEIHLSYLLDASEMLNDVPRFPLYIHLLSAVVCLGISSMFHLFYCHSEKCNSYLCWCDYAGISLLIGGSFFSPNYYGWYCKVYKIQLYLFLGIVEGLCILAFFVSLHSKFNAPEMRKWWAILYIFIGVMGTFPGIYLHFSDPFYVPSLEVYPWLAGGLIYIAGACIYACRIPEKYFKNKFDYWGMSHNIWHIMIIIAALFHFFGSLNVYH